MTDIGLQEFETALQDALNHLYDPAYQPAETLCAVLGCEPAAGAVPAQAAIVQAISALKPGPDAPATARGWRLYDVLACRYLQKMTQEEAAERLAITPRHLRREQTEAVSVLARHLWAAAAARGVPAIHPPVEAEPADWPAQLKQELGALQRSAAGSAADVEEALRGVVSLLSALASRSGGALRLGTVAPGLRVALPPAGLRQLLVGSLTAWLRHRATADIELSATRVGDRVVIALAGGAPPEALAEDALTRELLDAYGGTVEQCALDDRSLTCITLPGAAAVKVLAVDDNADLAHFYRRYVQGTRYEIVWLPDGSRLFEVVEETQPDVVVLDVMLPGMDGWELLAHLREHPLTRDLPVVVCSVVRAEELALSLGARAYVPKPVRRQEFIQALDYVLGSPTLSEAPAPPQRSAASR